MFFFYGEHVDISHFLNSHLFNKIRTSPQPGPRMAVSGNPTSNTVWWRYVPGVCHYYRQGSQNMFHMFRSIYPLYLMLRIFISLDTLFFTRTLHRFTASIYFLQDNSTAAAGIQKSGFNRHEFPEK
jgi:hypothetical protein